MTCLGIPINCVGQHKAKVRIKLLMVDFTVLIMMVVSQANLAWNTRSVIICII